MNFVATTRKRGHVMDEVLTKLRRGLMIGAFVPGQAMSIRKLASGMGTSAMPVREALRELIAAQALDELPNGSVCVPRLSSSRLQEIFTVRAVIESMAAKTAAQNGGKPLAKQLTEINKTLRDAIAKRSILGCLEANQSFHFTLYNAAQSEVLMPIIESLWLQSGPTMYFSLIRPDMPWDASEHDTIIKAVANRDAAVAEEHMAKDIRQTGAYLMRAHAAESLSGPFASPF